jgi:xylulokinase
MGQHLLMGIDIGTQSTRVAILDDKGNLVCSAGTPQDLTTPRPGWAEQDPQVWWDTTIANIRQVFTQSGVQPNQIAGIGVSGQMHGTVPVDEKGVLLSHGVQLWCDKRSADLVEEFKAKPGIKKTYRIAGSPPVANWFGFKIKWVQVFQPDIYQRTWKFMLPKDFINFRLTGEISTDWSEASGAFLMDASTKDWSPELIKEVGIDGEKLPHIHPSSSVIGMVSAEAASLTSLKEGTPVVAGAGDMLCMLLAAGITRPGRASDVTGSSSIASVFTNDPVVDERLMNLHHVMPGWIPFGIIDSGGLSLKWFKDSFCKAEILEAEKRGLGVYDILNDLANAVEPGTEGLLYFPYLMGERTLGTPYARGVLFGLTPRIGVGAVTRAIMEGVTFELRRTFEIIEAAGNEIDVIYHSGGGAYSDLWSQLKADIYGKPIAVFENSEGGILGSAILAGVGVGIYSDPASGAECCLKIAKTFTPRREFRERYDSLFIIFKDLHDRMQDSYNAMAKVS